jgi:hypothetical protein
MEYSQVSTKNIRNTSESTDIEALYKTSKTNPYRKTTYAQKCTKKSVCYTKYGLIFSGIITLILMVIFGINNIATNFENNNTTETSVLNATETSRVNESLSVHPGGVKVTTDIENLINPLDTNGTLSRRDNGSLNSKGLAFRSHRTERVNGGGEDIVISNKTVIINGGNDSITITN